MRLKQRKNEQGLAIIVVVGVMVALIMVTTALLSIVTQTRSLARTVMLSDYARLSAINAKTRAIMLIENEKTFINTNTDMLFQFTKDWGKTNTLLSEFILSHALPPYEREAKLNKTYIPGTILRAPFTNLAPNNATVVYNPPALSSSAYDTIYAESQADANSTDTIIRHADIWQYIQTSKPFPASSPWDTLQYHQYIGSLEMFRGKDLVEAITYADRAKAFYAIKGTFFVRDLGGSININDSNLTITYVNTLNSIRKLIQDESRSQFAKITQPYSAPYTPLDFDEAAENKKWAHSPQAIDAFFTSFDTNGRPVLTEPLVAQQFTAFGKNDKNGVPLCVNLHTAPRKLLKAMIRACTYPTVVANYDAIENAVFNLRGTFDPESTPSITDVANAINALAPGNAEMERFIFSLTGVLQSTANYADAGAIAGAIGSKTITGRLVAPGSDMVADPVNADTLGYGPYFYVKVRGAVFNMAKGERETVRELEFIYYRQPHSWVSGDPASRVVYQRWLGKE